MTLTLAIDIGGTGVKAIVLDGAGGLATERVRVKTPRPATAEAVLAAIDALVAPLGDFDRISVGFPGVVIDGVCKTAVNLDPTWVDLPFARVLAGRFGKPARVLNDAGVQGYAVIARKGVEMLLTFGTGMGCAIYVDGKYVPNLELAHHPFGNGKTYEEYVGVEALEHVGRKKWSKRVHKVVEQVLPIWNPTRLYLGGGNAKHIRFELPPNVEIVSNLAGLAGGFALWADVDAAAAAAR
ncbi:MAG: ROK family protein [Deltaproteobacteria bacterium]|nr:ROK family protein [Deltaproteobacteria bacterium]